MSQFRHLIGGCVGDVPHEPGDLVDPQTDQAKLEEWLAAGVIAAVKTVKPKTQQRKARDDHDNDQHTDRPE